MRYSIFSWFGYFQPFQERLDIIKEAGFDEVMLSWEDEFEPWALKKEDFPMQGSYYWSQSFFLL